VIGWLTQRLVIRSPLQPDKTSAITVKHVSNVNVILSIKDVLSSGCSIIETLHPY
jgi:hypothetical protein